MEKVSIRNRYSIQWNVLIALLLVLAMLTSYLNSGKLMGAINPMIRFFEYQAVAFQVRNYNELETDHFIIRYQEADEAVLNLVVNTAEDKFQQITKLFRYEPDNKILLILYDEPEAMMKITTLKRGTPPMGVYYGDALHILNPYHWIRDENELEEVFYHEGPILHEIVHLFLDHSAKGNFPIWFTEGVSLYFEYKVDNYQWGKGVEFRDGEYTLEELTNSFYELDQYLAYTKSFRIVKEYVDRKGLEALMQLINELGEGKKLESYYPLFKE